MTLLAIDGNSIINRAFYGIKALTTKDGKFTNAIYGFMTILLKLEEQYSPDHVAIAFDMRSPTFRHLAYPEYKANRHGMPEELAQQFPVLKELLGALGYKLIECEGFEADDILGTLSDECENNKMQCIIATGDRDSLQLVGEYTSVSLATTKGGRPETNLYDTDKILEEYGVSPAGLIEIKALQGDTSDNIPGVAGIGKKGAADLIQKYGTIDYIYSNLDSLDIKAGMKTKLINGESSAKISRKLGEICRSAPIDRNINSFSDCNKDISKAGRIMTELELFSIMKKMDISPVTSAEEQKVEKQEEIIFTFSENKDFPKDIKDAFFLADFDKNENLISLLINYKNSIIKVAPDIDNLKSFFENTEIKKTTTNTKTLYKALKKLDISPADISFDIELAAYILKPSASDYQLSNLCAEYNIALPIVTGCDEENAKICAALPYLKETLDNKLISLGADKLFYDIEMPLAKVLADMELQGFGIDADGIKNYGIILEEKISAYKQQIYDLAGCEFNINSPKQLGEILFVKLGLPAGKKTKTGYSTNADVLEGLKYSHPIIEPVIEYRGLCKLKSTYCDGLLKVISDDGRIHSSFNQTETRTGRISSTEPNLQNIPVRTEVGKEFRKFFRAKDGCMLVDADYSQIELRVLAHISNDKNMIDGFSSGDDIHAITASQVFGIPLNMTTSQLRSRAKAVNFGIVYGIGAFSLAKDIGVTRKEADEYIKSYLAHYSGIDNYMRYIAEKAKEDGYVTTMFGRRRFLPELKSSNFVTRSFGERVARNMPIQGTAADIIKIAMIKVSQRLESEGLKAKLILQIHDELIVEAPENECAQVKSILEEEMQNAVKLNVALPADAAIGKTWFDAKK
ncbi:MAG: DNA polymerase I [Clostridia bacterium]|nr:DNA polymerase I [Clostridia bacterium]